jgi:outer membrane protein assembly factor BamB
MIVPTLLFCKFSGRKPLKNFYLFWLFIFVFLTARPSTSDAIISERLLNQAGLETAWQNAIALNPKEKIQKVTILDNYLYILTDGNYLFCLDRNTGRLSFAASAAAPKLPVFEPTGYSGITYLIAANNLIAANIEQGAEIYRNRISFSAAAAAAVNASCLYIPGIDKRLHVTDLKGQREIFKASADNVSGITSVLATDSFVVFATDAGNVICMNPAKPKKLWQFDAVGAVTAPLTRISGWLYVGSRDTNLYKLDAGSGNMLWKFHTGSALTTPARATQSAVYQYAQDKGLYAIDANSGKLLWLLPDAVDLLTQDGSTAYIFDKNNTCIVMDNKQAKKIYTINFAPVTTFAANVYDNKIYIMEDKNISCVRPVAK